jgi:phosphoacetylglucosamine mutase
MQVLTPFIELALRVAGLVYDEAGGDPHKRPRDFL